VAHSVTHIGPPVPLHLGVFIWGEAMKRFAEAAVLELLAVLAGVADDGDLAADLVESVLAGRLSTEPTTLEPSTSSLKKR